MKIARRKRNQAAPKFANANSNGWAQCLRFAALFVCVTQARGLPAQEFSPPCAEMKQAWRDFRSALAGQAVSVTRDGEVIAVASFLDDDVVRVDRGSKSYLLNDSQAFKVDRSEGFNNLSEFQWLSDASDVDGAATTLRAVLSEVLAPIYVGDVPIDGKLTGWPAGTCKTSVRQVADDNYDIKLTFSSGAELSYKVSFVPDRWLIEKCMEEYETGDEEVTTIKYNDQWLPVEVVRIVKTRHGRVAKSSLHTLSFGDCKIGREDVQLDAFGIDQNELPSPPDNSRQSLFPIVVAVIFLALGVALWKLR